MLFPKVVARIQLVLQLFFIITQSWLFSFPAIAGNNINKSQKTAQQEIAKKNDNDNEKEIAASISSTAGLLAQDNATDAITSSMINAGTSKATQEVQQWLQQYGTARVNISVDNDLSLSSADLDFLLPLIDDKKQNLLFTQWGARRVDDRAIANAGIGYRHFYDSWMWGINTFYDRQISHNAHQRVGLGSELGWNYFKISTNGYKRLSGWKDSREHKDYRERAADGYDIRAEGYLPAWPHLGAQLVWEQYYGDDVALFGDDDDDRQKDPYAATIGLNYTPFPLVTMGVSQKTGKADKNETQVDLALNWTPGVSLSSHLDPDEVKQRRNLLGARHDLVNRNNNIILEFQKKELIKPGLPSKIEGPEEKTLPIEVKLTSKYPLQTITWQNQKLAQNGGKIDHKNNTWYIKLPHFRQNGEEKNIYVVGAVAIDSEGNKSEVAHMTVSVNGFDKTQFATKAEANAVTLPADGVSTTPVTVTITSLNGDKVTGLADTLSTQLTRQKQSKRLMSSPAVQEKISDYTEKSPGVYVSTFTSGTAAGSVLVQPMMDNTTKLANTTITLEEVNTTLTLKTLSASKNSAFANAKDAVTFTAHVVNHAGNPVKDVPVKWVAENSQATLSAASSKTDANGDATVQVTSAAVLNTTVTAQLDDGQKLTSKPVSFTTDTASAKVAAVASDKTNAKADNNDSITLSATVKDAGNHLLANVPVQWSVDAASGTAHVTDKESVTDDQGIATLTLKSPRAGEAIATAKIGNNSNNAVKSDKLTFEADSASAKLNSVTASKTTVSADGVDTATLTTQVVDAHNNPLSGIRVEWQSSTPDAQLSRSDTTTDNTGNASVTISSTVITKATVTASAEGQTQNSPEISFTADQSTANVTSVTSDKTQAAANGNDHITLTAHVTDKQKHPVSGLQIRWSVPQGVATLGQTTGITDAQGEATVTLTSLQAGDVAVAAKTDTGTNTLSAKLHFAADTATAKVSNITVDKTQAIANGSDKATYTALVTDASGNPLSNATVNWSVTPSQVALSETTTLSGSDGKTTITASTLKAGDVNVMAKVDNGTGWNAPAVSFIGDVSTAMLDDLHPDKKTALANGSDKITFSGTVKDANRNLLKNVKVDWDVTPTTGKLSAASGTTDMLGAISVSLTARDVGDYGLNASITGRNQGTVSITYETDIHSAKVVDLTSNTTGDVTANASVTLTAVVKDASNHPIRDALVNWESDNTKGQFSSASSQTDADGKATMTFASPLAKATLITAKSLNASEKSLSLNIVPDLASAHVTYVTSDKREAVANGNDKVELRATVLDQYDNPVQGQLPTFSLRTTTTNGFTLTGATPSNTAGVATMKLSSTQAAAVYPIADINNTPPIEGVGIRFWADTATEKIVSVSTPVTTGLVAGKDTITLSAVVRDANNNLVQDAVVHWGTDNTSGKFASDNSTTDANGVATVNFTVTKAKPTIAGGAINNSEMQLNLEYIGDVGTATLAGINADKTEAVADNTDLVTWSVTVKDANGNVLPGVAVNWNTTSSAVLTASTSNSGNDGVATITARSKKAEDVVVSATLAASGQKLDAAKVAFIGDSKTAYVKTLTVSKNTVLSNGNDSVTYTTEIRDANGNTVPNATVNWSTTLNNLSAATSKTDSAGIAKIILKGNQNGLVTVQALINSASKSNNTVNFIGTLVDNWTITADKATYKSAGIMGYSRMGFVVLGTTTGPTSLIWNSNTNVSSVVTTPVTLVSDSGQTYSVQFTGRRSTHCGYFAMNNAIKCGNGTYGDAARFDFDRSANPNIPPGHYTGMIHFLGKEWPKGPYGFEFKLNVDLTVR